MRSHRDSTSYSIQIDSGEWDCRKILQSKIAILTTLVVIDMAVEKSIVMSKEKISLLNNDDVPKSITSKKLNGLQQNI